ncbi:MAG: DUF87 domain-containing protein [Coriobacteriia bacterium]|nr:DUF87 domain-containing protein [Coriobacteriia bacterium]
MKIVTDSLRDDRLIGCAVFEIASFPEFEAVNATDRHGIESLYQNFTHALSEYFHFGQGTDSAIELLWLTQEAKNQAFRSRLRVFCVVRAIASAKEEIEMRVRQTYQHLVSVFSSEGFEVTKSDDAYDDIFSLFGKGAQRSLIAVEKSEKLAGNLGSVYPYYYPEAIPVDTSDNFTSLISMLSECSECGVSLQLIPAVMESQERTWLNEASGELSRYVEGVYTGRGFYRDPAAKDPYQALNYYQSHMNSPLFLYNILVFGHAQDCNQVAAKIVSLLQTGKQQVVNIDCRTIDLSRDDINLKEQFLFYPWNINRKLIYQYRNLQALNSIPTAQALFRLPFLVTSEEAAVFFRLPLHEKEMGAIKSAQVQSAAEHFDASVVSEDNIQFGTLAHPDASALTIGCPEKAFSKHALLVGMPGSGKTTFSINLLLQFAKKGIPFLAIEPTKAEYRALINAIPDIQIFTPGNNTVSPFIINPFLPPKGIMVEQYVPSLAVAFKAAFAMPSPLDNIFLKAVQASYKEYGWKDYSKQGDPDVKPFGLYEFILRFKQIVEDSDYGKEVKGNLESAGVIRLMNLIEQNSNIFDTIKTVPLEDILQRPTVIELNSIDNTEQKALIIALLLIGIGVHTKNNSVSDGKLHNIILIDEAHVLLGGGSSGVADEANPQAITIKSLQDMIAEIRAYGTGIIIADQSPTKVSREVVANTDIKVAFRLVQSVEKELIADSTNMDEKTEQQLSRLKPGEAYMYFSGLENPQRIITKDIREQEGIPLTVSNDEVAQKMTYWADKKDQLKPFMECKYSAECNSGCDFRLRSQADYYAAKILMRYSKELSSDKTALSYLKAMNKILGKVINSTDEAKRAQMIQCARIRFARKVRLEKGFNISPVTLKKILEDGVADGPTDPPKE